MASNQESSGQNRLPVLMNNLYNIRLTKDIKTPTAIYKAGECMKAIYWQSDGTARPWLHPGLILKPDEFRVIMSEDVFEKLLAQ